jgi:hypothetical protein
MVVQIKEPPQVAKMGRIGMLIIRKVQDEQLSQVTRTEFEDRMILHINKHFPTHYEALGEGNCRELIRNGIVRAEQYEITSEIDVARYIDLSVVLGLDFDSDQRHPWAAEILNNPSLKSGAKLQQIMDFLKRVRAERKTQRSQ